MIKKSTALKFLITIVLTLLTLIILKGNPNFKPFFYKYVHEDNISFAKINDWYEKAFGNPIPFLDILRKEEYVFEEKLMYKEANIYKDGVSLNVGENYLVPSLEDGIVTFIGEKEGYGKTVIIEQSNGITVWYSNLDEINITIYDYIKKGSVIASSYENLYLVFYENGEVIDYKEYI